MFILFGQMSSRVIELLQWNVLEMCATKWKFSHIVTIYEQKASPTLVEWTWCASEWWRWKSIQITKVFYLTEIHSNHSQKWMVCNEISQIFQTVFECCNLSSYFAALSTEWILAHSYYNSYYKNVVLFSCCPFVRVKIVNLAHTDKTSHLSCENWTKHRFSTKHAWYVAA